MGLVDRSGAPLGGNRAQRRAAGPGGPGRFGAHPGPPPVQVRPWGDDTAWGMGWIVTANDQGEPVVVCLRFVAAAGDVQVQADGSILLRSRPNAEGHTLLVSSLEEWAVLADTEVARVTAAADAVAEAEAVAADAADTGSGS